MTSFSLEAVVVAVAVAIAGFLEVMRRVRKSATERQRERAERDRDALQKQTKARINRVSDTSDDEWLRRMAAKSRSRHDS